MPGADDAAAKRPGAGAARDPRRHPQPRRSALARRRVDLRRDGGQRLSRRADRGSEIRGLDAAAGDPDIKIFHAGTKREGERILAAGGRVLGVTATGPDLSAARDRAYRAVDRIVWPGGFCRRDIGRRGTG
jgi:hypothetical protein